MNPQQLIAQHFIDEASVTAYMTGRLSINKAQAASLVANYHVSERLEDVLFTIYYENGFSNEQKQWFWSALNAVAKTAWQTKQADIFERTVYLYSRLSYEEASQFNWLSFFTPDEIQWNKDIDAEGINLYSSALSLIFAWQLEANNPLFWQDQFRSIVELLAGNENLRRPLNYVFDALDRLTGEQWGRLFISCQNSKKLCDWLQHYLAIHFELCEDDARKELDLIDCIWSAIRKVKASVPKGVNEEIVKIINTWSELPWWAKAVQIKLEKLRQLLIKAEHRQNVSPMKYFRDKESRRLVA
jgi:hypothetical protein